MRWPTVRRPSGAAVSGTGGGRIPVGGEGAPAAPRTWRRGRRRPCCSPATRRAPSPSPVRREAADPTGHRARGQPDRPWPVARGRGPVGRDPDHAAVARAPVHPSPVSDLAARGGGATGGDLFPREQRCGCIFVAQTFVQHQQYGWVSRSASTNHVNRSPQIPITSHTTRPVCRNSGQSF